MTSPMPLNFLIISTMLLGMINLVAPFFTKEDSKIRSFFLLSISIFFLFNVGIIDDLFIKGTVIKFTLLDIGKYSIAFSIEPLGLIFQTLNKGTVFNAAFKIIPLDIRLVGFQLSNLALQIVILHANKVNAGLKSRRHPRKNFGPINGRAHL